MLKSVTDPFQHGAAPVGSRPAGRWYRRHLYAALGSGALLAGALGYIGLVDPHNPDSVFPVCPFRLLTGWNCPACGALRMTHDVLHGDLVAAINDNVLVLVGIPVLAGWILLRRRRGKSLLTMPAAATVVITMLAWTVVRNLPGFPLVPTLLTH
jgi:Protein of unknown function (DUF2752)